MQEEARLLIVKNALNQTTKTSGWRYVKQIADNAVSNATQDALDEEDPVKGESKRLKAKALQQGFKEVFDAIENVLQIETENEPDWFEALSYEIPAER